MKTKIVEYKSGDEIYYKAYIKRFLFWVDIAHDGFTQIYFSLKEAKEALDFELAKYNKKVVYTNETKQMV